MPDAAHDRRQRGEGGGAVAAAVVKDHDRAGPRSRQNTLRDLLRGAAEAPVGRIDRPEHDALAERRRGTDKRRRGAAAPRRRTARRRSARPLVVTPRTNQLRGGLRATGRRSADTRFLRTNNPLPPRLKRRPQTQPRTAHDPRHTKALTPSDDRPHRTTPPRRQNTTRSKPLPQALPRPQPLPPPRTRTAAGHLTDIEASLAQSRCSPSRRVRTSPAALSAAHEAATRRALARGWRSPQLRLRRWG